MCMCTCIHIKIETNFVFFFAEKTNFVCMRVLRTVDLDATPCHQAPGQRRAPYVLCVLDLYFICFIYLDVACISLHIAEVDLVFICCNGYTSMLQLYMIQMFQLSWTYAVSALSACCRCCYGYKHTLHAYALNVSSILTHML